MIEKYLEGEIKEYFFIVFGCLFLALGVVWFFIPNALLTGGTAGLALLLHYISSFSVGFWMVAINLPLLVIGIKYLGKKFAIKTVITIIFISLTIDFFCRSFKTSTFC